MKIILCHYCLKPPKLVKGDVIYPYIKYFDDKQFYLCETCDAYVGCHIGTSKPLGRLADYDLRQAKMAAHAAFDPIWKEYDKEYGGTYSYSNARKLGYSWLSRKLNVPYEECHIDMFDVDMCNRVVMLCNKKEQSR